MLNQHDQFIESLTDAAVEALGRAVQEHRALFGVLLRENAQRRAGYRDLADEWRAVSHADAARQPLKRRKISEPLVPPKPKEFDNAASICSLRAVLGT